MQDIRFLTLVLLLGTLLLSACGGAIPASAPEAAASANVKAMPVAFVGIVERIAGDQWVISGTTVTVDETIVRDGPFHVGDQVKVEGQVNPDGSFAVWRVEAPTPQATATLPPFADDNSSDNLTNGNTNGGNINDDQGSGVNSNDDNANSANPNDDHGKSNSNDDHGGSSSNDDYGGGGNGNED